MNASEAIFDESIQIAVCERIDTASAPAVSAAGPPARHVFFAAESGYAIAAFAGMDFNGGFVYELHLGTAFGISFAKHQTKKPYRLPIGLGLQTGGLQRQTGTI
jgi:hypothetical protein